MNKKVFTSMLTLTILFLCGMYVFKIFFPQEFVMCVENEKIVAIGKYIDSHMWLSDLLAAICTFIGYWLYLCAVCKKKYLNWKECIVVLVTIAISILMRFVGEQFVTYMNIFPMIILPFLFGANIKEVAIVYPIHGLAQVLSLSIRDLPMYMENANSLSGMMMTFECYLWLILFYIIYNYKQKEV